MDAVHVKKNHDYAQEGNPFSNFERAAVIVSWFKNDIDKVFACLIGVKLARLAELRNGKTPNNESIRDNGIDLTNYAGLWQAYWDYINDPGVGKIILGSESKKDPLPNPEYQI